MIFAPGPNLSNFGADSLSLSRMNAGLQFLVVLELTGSKSSQLGTDAAPNTQQNATGAFHTVQRGLWPVIRRNVAPASRSRDSRWP